MDTVYRTEGVVLEELPFKDHDRILTVFTLNGLLKFFIKGRGLRIRALTSPLTVGEFLYTQGRGDLLRFRDGSVLEQNLRIRDRLESLQAVEKFLKALNQSQWPGKPAPLLYRLFRLFLSHLGEAKYPQHLSTALFLKILKHEGILQLENRCSICNAISSMRFSGECYCDGHAPIQAQRFCTEEEILIQKLAQSRSIDEIDSLAQGEDFAAKIESLFEQAFQH